MKTVTHTNDAAAQTIDAINEHFAGELNGKRIAVWGFSNEWNGLDTTTCDVVEWLLAQGATVSVHDDSVVDEIKARFGSSVECPEKKWDAVRHANAVVVASHKAQYCNVDAGRLTWSVDDRALFDIHGTVNRDSLKYSSFYHFTADGEYSETVTLPFTGRSTVQPTFASAALALVG